MKQLPKGIKRRVLIMGFINEFIETNGFSPSVREVMEGSGLKSTSTAKAHLDVLKKQGHINFREDRSRTITVIQKEIKEYPW
jgi:SOS-response transcriptional repressor LexA